MGGGSGLPDGKRWQAQRLTRRPRALASLHRVAPKPWRCTSGAPPLRWRGSSVCAHAWWRPAWQHCRCVFLRTLAPSCLISTGVQIPCVAGLRDPAQLRFCCYSFAALAAGYLTLALSPLHGRGALGVCERMQARQGNHKKAELRFSAAWQVGKSLCRKLWRVGRPSPLPPAVHPGCSPEGAHHVGLCRYMCCKLQADALAGVGLGWQCVDMLPVKPPMGQACVVSGHALGEKLASRVQRPLLLPTSPLIFGTDRRVLVGFNTACITMPVRMHCIAISCASPCTELSISPLGHAG
jgi:hypothetical protein